MDNETQKNQFSEEEEFVDAMNSVFSQDDVVSSKSDDELIAERNNNSNLNEIRKKGKTSKDSSELKSYEQTLEENFQDFLVLKNLAGRKSSYLDLNRIPKDIIHDYGNTVEIDDDPKFHNKSSSSQSGVILHRDDTDTVKRIEIICSCGERTIIDLDYEN